MNEEKDNNAAIRGSQSQDSLQIGAKVESESSKLITSHDNNDDDEKDPQFFLSEGNRDFIYKRFTSAIQAYTRGLERIVENGKSKKQNNSKEEEKGWIWSSAKTEDQPKSSNNKNVTNEGKDSSSSSLEKETEMKKNANNNLNLNLSLKLDLLSNRALAYLSIENYPSALQDTKEVLSVNPTHFKAIVRQAKAFVGLEQFQNAVDCVDKSLKLLVKSEEKSCNSSSNAGKSQEKIAKLLKEERKELLQYFQRLKWQKRQAETGDFFDIPLIMDRSFEPAPAEWVNYIGEVAVKNIEGRGRGLVATADLPPSKLILAYRAFEIIFLDGKWKPEENLSEESLKALNDGDFKKEQDPTLNLLARKVYDKLVISPEKRADFYQLHAGNELGHIEPPSEPSEPPPLDMARIYGICRTNTFANSGDSYPEVEKSVGIWLFPAYVNHQCVGGNCTWKIFGDFIFVRTYKAVKKGEELTHSYVSPSYSLQLRTNVLTNRLGFVCSCALCKLDLNLPMSVHEEKDKLKQLVLKQDVQFTQLEISENSEEYAKKIHASILLLEQIISKLEKMQPHHGQYNASLLDPLQKLGLKYFGVGEFQKSIKVMERAVELMKSCMLPHAIADCAMWIIAAYLQMGNQKQAKKWGKALKDSLVQAYGDVQVLKILGAWMIEPMVKWGYIE